MVQQEKAETLVMMRCDAEATAWEEARKVPGASSVVRAPYLLGPDTTVHLGCSATREPIYALLDRITVLIGRYSRWVSTRVMMALPMQSLI